MEDPKPYSFHDGIMARVKPERLSWALEPMNNGTMEDVSANGLELV